METNKKTAARIKKIREEKKITAKYVAEKMDMDTGSYSRFENGQTQITVTNLYKISAILQVALNDILQLEERNVYTNHNNTVMQQGTIHSLNISLNPEEFNKLIKVFETGK
jgi:transcriptional regulator with XRE-family HTH domain